ncbi:MAG: accessory Sec system protein Asp1 [Lachnospiraceae bacterium]|nr:accessory Sec system protein Asp1 [Lachnospiraceae bacterium]
MWNSFPVRWYRKGIRMEFDDTVNQIKLFQRAGENVKLVLLCYMPELRRFLHREGIQNIEIWSVFDVIQGIKGQLPGIFSYHDMSWPDDLEWVYTPFLALAYRNDEKYAKVEFGEGGHAVFAELYRKGKISRRIYIDDRGFLSCALDFQNEKEVRRTYFDQDGKWRVREDLQTGAVTVNPKIANVFQKLEYSSMSDLILEVLSDSFENEVGEGVVITAYDNRHNEMVRQVARGRKMVFSLFQKRNQIRDFNLAAEDMFRYADMIVTDTEYLANHLRKLEAAKDCRIMDLSPYDARVSLGKSQRIRELKILCYLQDLQDEQMAGVKQLLCYVNGHRDTELIIGVGNSLDEQLARQYLETETERIVSKNRLNNIYPEKNKQEYSENEIQEEYKKNVLIRSCRSETEIIEILKEMRIIVELSPEPDLYLQIAGISAGVPMVLKKDSQYVTHQENGWILQEMNELDDALDYFLNGLENWNKSLVHSVHKIAGYTNGAIVKRWKELLETRDQS